MLKQDEQKCYVIPIKGFQNFDRLENFNDKYFVEYDEPNHIASLWAGEYKLDRDGNLIVYELGTPTATFIQPLDFKPEILRQAQEDGTIDFKYVVDRLARRITNIEELKNPKIVEAIAYYFKKLNAVSDKSTSFKQMRISNCRKYYSSQKKMAESDRDLKSYSRLEKETLQCIEDDQKYFENFLQNRREQSADTDETEIDE